MEYVIIDVAEHSGLNFFIEMKNSRNDDVDVDRVRQNPNQFMIHWWSTITECVIADSISIADTSMHIDATNFHPILRTVSKS